MKLPFFAGNNAEKAPAQEPVESDRDRRHLLRLKAHSRRMGWLLTYDLLPNQWLTVVMSGRVEEGLQIEQDRTVTARLLDRKYGLLRVVGDTELVDSWQDQKINLGSYAGGTRGPISGAGLTPGMLFLGAHVAVDHRAENFQNWPAVSFVEASYSEIHVNDVRIF